MELSLEQLLRLKTAVLKYLSANAVLNEANTKAVLVEPLLELLGWDVRSTDEVNREWRRPKSKDDPADYALIVDEKKLLLLEAKALRDPLTGDKGWRQLAANGLHAGFRWCARTNGRRYILIDLLHEAEMKGKVFWDVDLATVDEPEGPRAQVVAENLRLMSKEALLSGETDRAWRQQQQQRQVRDAVERAMADPPQELIELIRREAGDHQIDGELVRAYLRAFLGRGSAEVERQGRRPKPTRPGRGVKRTSVSMVDLLAKGLVKAGDQLRFIHKGATHLAQIHSDGSISVAGRSFASPSGAGTAVAGRACAGWDAWRYRDAAGSWQPISRLRHQLTGGAPGAAEPADVQSVEAHLQRSPGSRAVYDGLRRLLEAIDPAAIVVANSKHITFTRPPVFAAIRCRKQGVRVGLRLPDTEARLHPRLSVQPKGIFEGWDALHVSLTLASPDDLDREVSELLLAAYERAGG